MGENDGGQSSTTQDDQTDSDSRGFFSRIFEALSPSDNQTKNGVHDPELTRDTGQVPGLLNLRLMRVEEVAVPNPDIVALPITATKADLVKVFRDSGLTRLPIFDGTLDTPIGLAHLKDFALKYGFSSREKFNLREMLRPLLFVPPSMPLGVLLQKMQADRIHMALVIDEYGGTDGLVTIENLIEQVVGEIADEHDLEESQSWIVETPGVYVALAKTALDEFEAEIGMVLTDHAAVDEEEIETLGGLVSMLSGRVPVRGEVIRHSAGVEFEIMDADPRRIKRIRVRLASATGS